MVNKEMHQANKYMRVQDQNGQVAVIVPETDFILHARQMRDLTNKVEQMNEDLKLLNGKHHEYINYQKRTEEKIATEVQKARTQQRQEDAKVYAHWRDKCKSLEKHMEQSVNLEKNYKLLSESYSNLLSKYADRHRQLLVIKGTFEHDTEQSDSK